MSFFRRGPQVNFLSTGCLCVSVILGVTWGSKGCCFFLQIPVIFFKSTKLPWRVSMCPNTFMSGLTWCLASSRGAVKLWRLTTVTWPTATLSTRGAKTCQRLIFISSFSFLSVSPTDLWGRDRLWQVQKRNFQMLIPPRWPNVSPLSVWQALRTPIRESPCWHRSWSLARRPNSCSPALTLRGSPRGFRTLREARASTHPTLSYLQVTPHSTGSVWEPCSCRAFSFIVQA